MSFQQSQLLANDMVTSTERNASLLEMESHNMAKPICARNGPSSAKQELSRAKPRSSHSISPSHETCPHPHVLFFLLVHNISPKDTVGVISQAESCMMHICVYSN